MAKKNSSVRKPVEEPNIKAGEGSSELSSGPEVVTSPAPSDETTLVKPGKVKAAEDQAPAGSVGLGDIRKAVAFANSVGGLHKAVALLQIVKVAKEVQ